jgi:hypothetical protein
MSMSAPLSLQDQLLEGLKTMAEEADRNTPEPARVMLNGYFDESGKLGDTEIVSFGGCYGVHEGTKKLNELWELRLRQDEIRHTSMKEAIHFQGPYLKWYGSADGEQKRDNLLRDLARAIIASGMLVISSPMPRRGFEALSQAERKEFWNDPQYSSFEACVNTRPPTLCYTSPATYQSSIQRSF